MPAARCRSSRPFASLQVTAKKSRPFASLGTVYTSSPSAGSSRWPLSSMMNPTGLPAGFPLVKEAGSFPPVAGTVWLEMMGGQRGRRRVVDRMLRHVDVEGGSDGRIGLAQVRKTCPSRAAAAKWLTGTAAPVQPGITIPTHNPTSAVQLIGARMKCFLKKVAGPHGLPLYHSPRWLEQQGRQTITTIKAPSRTLLSVPASRARTRADPPTGPELAAGPQLAQIAPVKAPARRRAGRLQAAPAEEWAAR